MPFAKVKISIGDGPSGYKAIKVEYSHGIEKQFILDALSRDFQIETFYHTFKSGDELDTIIIMTDKVDVVQRIKTDLRRHAGIIPVEEMNMN